jgi:hypothetical protein
VKVNNKEWLRLENSTKTMISIQSLEPIDAIKGVDDDGVK